MAIRRLAPVAVPALLALAYVVVLVLHYPRLIGWENSDSDIASAFNLTEAIGRGHTGLIVFGAQGSWAPLAFGLLTRGLSFHRLLWEISPILLSFAAAALIAGTVARLAGRSAGVLALSVLIAGSPTVLANASAACFHNTTIIGTALLGAYLVWLRGDDRGRRATVVSGVIVAGVTGLFIASDGLLLVDGLIPFVGAPLVLAWRRGDRRGLPVVLAAAIGSLVVASIVAHVTASLGLIPNTPAPRLAPSLIGRHLGWLADGLLHLGGAQGGAPGSPPAFLIAAAATITVVAIIATLGTGAVTLRRSATPRWGDAAALHACFWAGSLLSVSLAYAVTTVAVEPSDRYLTIAVPAMAAVVPLYMVGPRRWIIAAAASVLVATSLIAVAGDAERGLIRQGPAVAVLTRIETVVRTQHLGVGYAGYWDAAALTWSSAGKLAVYPITDALGPTAPMFQNRAASWYVPRPRTPSYVVLAPGDPDLSDHVPRGLPQPRREIRLGTIRIAVYPFDIARDLARPYIP